ncbi:MAG: ferrochelatase, partial [Pseudomonadota bacterium]
MATLPEDHPAIKAGKTGILLLHLGTPDSPTPKDVRKFLARFLSDRRVIETSPFIWWPILHSIILPLRPRRVAKAYAAIFSEGISPLRRISLAQAEKLQATLGEDYVVHAAATYGAPDIATTINAMAEQGCRSVTAWALYPHYSATTTAASYDRVFRHLQTMRWQPQIRTIASYHDHPAYIAALAQLIRDDLAKLTWQ